MLVDWKVGGWFGLGEGRLLLSSLIPGEALLANSCTDKDVTKQCNSQRQSQSHKKSPRPGSQYKGVHIVRRGGYCAYCEERCILCILRREVDIVHIVRRGGYCAYCEERWILFIL